MSHLDALHYHLIVALLLAGDIQARVVHNNEYTGVEVKTDRSRIIWGNDGDTWAYTEIDSDGTTSGGVSELDAEASPDDVAIMIVTRPVMAD